MNRILITIFAVVIGVVVGNSVVSRNSQSVDKILERSAKKLNETLPMQVDKETRLDTTVAGPGKKFTYLYTLPNLTKAECEKAGLIEKMRPTIVNAYKTTPELKYERDHDVELCYEYRDKDGIVVGSISVSPKDF